MAGELAKVLWYYNLIPTVDEPVQKIVCPFHGDVNPSMSVDLVCGTCYCFGCNETFGAKKIVQKMESKYHGLNELKSELMYNKILKSKKCSDINVEKAAKTYNSRKNKKQLYDEAYDYYH